MINDDPSLTGEMISPDASSDDAMRGLKENRDRLLAEKKRLQSELAELKATLAGLNPEEILTIRQSNQQLQASLDKLKQDNLKAIQQLSSVEFRSCLQRKALQAGVHEGAADDIVSRAQAHHWYKHHNGDYEAYNADGTPYLRSDGQPYFLMQWLKDLSKYAPHLFRSSQGGGAQTQVSARNARTYSYDLQDLASGKILPS